MLAGRIIEATAARPLRWRAQRLLVNELPDAIDDEADAIMADIQLNAARVREVADMIEGERTEPDAVGVRARRRQRRAGGRAGVAGAEDDGAQEAIVRRRSEELEGFAGRVAHDLLNPISAAEMSLAATERGAAGNERMTTLAARGGAASSGRAALVDDLFSFAQAGARPVPGVTTAVAEVVEGVIEELRTPALGAQHHHQRHAAGAPVAVRCANGVLASLLSNVDKLFHIRRAEARLQEAFGREATDDEIAEELDSTPEKIRELRTASQRPASLEAPLGYDSDNRVADVVADDNADDPYEMVEEKANNAMLREVMKDLDPREVTILRYRFGLDGDNEKTLEEVGRKFGLTRERIRQIQEIALKKLRKKIEKLEATRKAA